MWDLAKNSRFIHLKGKGQATPQGEVPKQRH